MHRSLLSSLLLLAACQSTGPAELSRSPLSRIVNPSVPAADASALVSANTQLATSLHRSLSTTSSGNFVYSPYGISFNMAMLREELSPDAKGALDAALGFVLPDARLDAAWDGLDLSLIDTQGKTSSSGRGQQFQSASAIWTQQELAPGYLDTLAQYYGTGVLTGQNPAQSIAGWQATLPGDAMPFELAQPCDLALISNVRLDAAWQTPFDPSATAAGSFHRADGSVVSAQMMRNEDVTLSASTSGVPAVEIPYDGDRLSMLIIMPDDVDSFDASLSPKVIEDTLARLKPAELDLTLPKLTFGSSTSVLPALQQAGLPLDAGHWTIWHSATLAVDEAGTIAAATTATSHTPSSVHDTTPFVVDRPFVFFIRDRASGSILFGGRVLDPTK